MRLRTPFDEPLSPDPRGFHNPEWDWFWDNVDSAINVAYGNNRLFVRDFGRSIDHWEENTTSTVDMIAGVSPYGKTLTAGRSGFDIAALEPKGTLAIPSGTLKTTLFAAFAADGEVVNTSGNIYQSGGNRSFQMETDKKITIRNGDLIATSADAVPSSGPFTVAGYYANLADAWVYINGEQNGTPVTGGSNWGQMVPPDNLMGRDGVAGYLGVYLCFYAFWNYKLTDAQHRQLHNDWCGPFREPDEIIAFVAAAAAAGPKGPLGHPLHGPLAGPVGP